MRLYANDREMKAFLPSHRQIDAIKRHKPYLEEFARATEGLQGDKATMLLSQTVFDKIMEEVPGTDRLFERHLSMTTDDDSIMHSPLFESALLKI